MKLLINIFNSKTARYVLLFIMLLGGASFAQTPRISMTTQSSTDTIQIALESSTDSATIYICREHAGGGAIDTLTRTIYKNVKGVSIPMISTRVSIIGNVSYFLIDDFNHANTVLTIDASNHSILTHFYFLGNSLDTGLRTLRYLNVSNCTALGELGIEHTRLSSADSFLFNGCTKLKRINCRHGLLDSLDVSGCDSLTNLECPYNQLRYLRLNSQIALVYCSNNLLENIQVNNLPNVRTILANNNLLTSLDVSNCDKLTTLECCGNLMTACALDSLFNTLPYRPSSHRREIRISVRNLYGDSLVDPNPGTFTCHTSLATRKEWHFTDSISGDGSGCCSEIKAYNMEIKNITLNSAIIAWEDSLAHFPWSLSFWKENDTAVTSIEINKTSHTLKGLLPWTTYHVAVRAVCPETAAWSDTLTFLTLRDHKIMYIEEPKPDSCKLAGTAITPQALVYNGSSAAMSRLAIYADIDSAGHLKAHLVDTILFIEPMKTHFHTFTSAYNVPYMPIGSRYGVKVYMDSVADDADLSNDTVSILVCVDSSSSITEQPITEKAIRLHPNPVNGTLHIESEMEISKVEVYDLLGHRQIITTHANEIDCSQLSVGIYFVKVFTERGNIARKFIKE